METWKNVEIEKLNEKTLEKQKREKGFFLSIGEKREKER